MEHSRISVHMQVHMVVHVPVHMFLEGIKGGRNGCILTHQVQVLNNQPNNQIKSK